MEIYQTLLVKIARALDGAGISYMIIGGQAVLLHGEPRLTRDIDVTVASDASELARILSITRAADLHPSVKGIEEYLTLWLSSFRDVVHRDLVSEYLSMKSERSR